MKLYDDPFSPNSRKVSITANLLDIAMDKVTVRIPNGDQRRPEIVKLNPNAKVPILVDGDFVLWESNAIMQYLAMKRPGTTLWPDDARTRVDITRWQLWEQAHWQPACGTLIFEYMIKAILKLGEPDPVVIKKGETDFARYATVLNDHLSKRTHLVGNRLTLADVSVATVLIYSAEGRLPVSSYPSVERWFTQIAALDSWKDSAPTLAA